MPAKKNYTVDWSKLPCAPAEVSWRIFHKLLANTRKTYDADANSVNVRDGGFNHAIAELGFNPIASVNLMVEKYPCHLEPRKRAPSIVTGLKAKCPNCQRTKVQPRQLNDSQAFAVSMAQAIKTAMTQEAKPAKPAKATKAKAKATKRSK